MQEKNLASHDARVEATVDLLLLQLMVGFFFQLMVSQTFRATSVPKGLTHMTLNHDIQVEADQVFDRFAAKKDRRLLLWEVRSSFVACFSKCSWFCFLNFNYALSSVNNVNINTFLAFMAAILGRLRPPPLWNQILGNCLRYNIIFYLFGSLKQGSHRQI